MQMYIVFYECISFVYSLLFLIVPFFILYYFLLLVFCSYSQCYICQTGTIKHCQCGKIVRFIPISIYENPLAIRCKIGTLPTYRLDICRRWNSMQENNRGISIQFQKQIKIRCKYTWFTFTAYFVDLFKSINTRFHLLNLWNILHVPDNVTYLSLYNFCCNLKLSRYLPHIVQPQGL